MSPDPEWKLALEKLKNKNKAPAQPPQPQGEIEEIEEEEAQETVKVQQVAQQPPRKLRIEPKPQPMHEVEEDNITPEEAELLVQKLLNDEDVILYMKMLQGEAKLKLVQKLQQ